MTCTWPACWPRQAAGGSPRPLERHPAAAVPARRGDRRRRPGHGRRRLFTRIPVPDVALSQHLLPGIAGTVGTCPGPFMSAEDGIAITVYGRGGHGALRRTPSTGGAGGDDHRPAPDRRLREVTPGDTAIVTVGAVQAGARGNVIGDHAVLQLNMRSYSEPTRQRMLDAIRRSCAAVQASGSRGSRVRDGRSFALLDNDTAAPTGGGRVHAAWPQRARPPKRRSARLGVPAGRRPRPGARRLLAREAQGGGQGGGPGQGQQGPQEEQSRFATPLNPFERGPEFTETR